MKIEHKTEKVTICFFLPPTEADRFKFFNDEEPYLSYFIGAETFRKRFQKGFNLIGLTSEVTEKQAKMMVDNLDGYGLWFKDANGRSGHKYALSAFKSLMHNRSIFEVNPYSDDDGNEFLGYGDDLHKKYKEAQLNVGKWIVLFKPND